MLNFLVGFGARFDQKLIFLNTFFLYHLHVKCNSVALFISINNVEIQYVLKLVLISCQFAVW